METPPLNGSVADFAYIFGDKKFTFLFSTNEEKFARANIHNYSVFMVVNDKKIKQISDNDLKFYLNKAQVETKKCTIILDDDDL